MAFISFDMFHKLIIFEYKDNLPLYCCDCTLHYAMRKFIQYASEIQYAGFVIRIHFSSQKSITKSFGSFFDYDPYKQTRVRCHHDTR